MLLNQVKEDMVYMAFNTNWRGVHTVFWWKTLKEALGRLDIDGRIIFKLILKKG
jgi:hypothetical protein